MAANISYLPSSLLENEFPFAELSVICRREKSIRQGHISTLQQWWARRPLAICRATVFAALCPSPETLAMYPELVERLGQIVPEPGTISAKLAQFTSKLSEWKSSENDQLLQFANTLIMAGRDEVPTVVDTFAGGGSIPLEALRLRVNSLAGELNPVAVTALQVALHFVPSRKQEIIHKYQRVARELEKRIARAVEHLYQDSNQCIPLAFFWCHTYQCPSCNIEVPLLHDFWLAKGKRNAAVSIKLMPGNSRFTFSIYQPETPEQKREASRGTVNQTGAFCPNCAKKVATNWLREQGMAGELGERLYAKLVRDVEKGRVYSAASEQDEYFARNSSLRPVVNRHIYNVPEEEFDANGIRHTWVMQYGRRTTKDLYNHRQAVALLEVFHEMWEVKTQLFQQEPFEDALGVVMLLGLTFNRLVTYGTRQAWWQSNGEFPAGMFGRQAIPMVWNYLEVPVHSPAAAGWASAVTWIEKVCQHLAMLPAPAKVWQGDSAHVPLSDASVDLVAIDPPYYDSIAYSYLADTYYVWLRAFLGDVLPQEYSGTLSPKTEEIIVDRKHRLAPMPKTQKHFIQKLTDAFVEARRIIKPEGQMVIMYGHKKVEAWAAMLQAVVDANFELIVSWPVSTERKVKFRHNHIDALSSSCLLICRPAQIVERERISWDDFEAELRAVLERQIIRFQVAHILGSDLLGALIGPAFRLYQSYVVLDDQNRAMSITEFLRRLPVIVGECEMAIVKMHESLAKYSGLWQVIEEFVAERQIETESVINRKTERLWTSYSDRHPIVDSSATYAKLLYQGRTQEADTLWNKLTLDERQLGREFLRAAAILSSTNSPARKLALASLGRISNKQ